MHKATADDTTTRSDATARSPAPQSQIDLHLPVDGPHEQLMRSDPRLRQLHADKHRREALLSRKQRQATKRQKAAKKRAEASRRRNAA